MATHTKRDRVWNAALQLAHRTGRGVLTTMAVAEWLRKHTAPEDGRQLYGAEPKLDAGERLSDAKR